MYKMLWLPDCIFVIRPLPCQVRLHGRSKQILNKKVVLWFGEEFARVVYFIPGSPLLCPCLALPFTHPSLILYLSYSIVILKIFYGNRPYWRYQPGTLNAQAQSSVNKSKQLARWWCMRKSQLNPVGA